jgi:predicted ABC-type ATPase
VIAAEAARRKMNYLVDGTGDASAASMMKKIQRARAAGHKVVGKYVTVDTEEALRRSDARARTPGPDFGRFVDPDVTRAIHAGVTDTFDGLIAQDAFDAVELWDTNGPKPLLVGQKLEGGTWKVADPRAWQRFLAKGHDRPSG